MKRIFLAVACMAVFGSASAQVEVPAEPADTAPQPAQAPVDANAPVSERAPRTKISTGMIVAGLLVVAAVAGGSGGGGGDKPSSP